MPFSFNMGQEIDCRASRNSSLHKYIHSSLLMSSFLHFWKQAPHSYLHKGEKWGSNEKPSSPRNETNERLADSTSLAAVTTVLLADSTDWEGNQGAKNSYFYSPCWKQGNYICYYSKKVLSIAWVPKYRLICFDLSQAVTARLLWSSMDDEERK